MWQKAIGNISRITFTIRNNKTPHVLLGKIKPK